MTHDCRPRHYTDQAGRIIPEVIEATALRWWAPQGLDHAIRRGTLAEQTETAMDYARREQEWMQANPLRASIDTVDWYIATLCRDGHDSLIREAAILADSEGRAAVLLRRYHPSAGLSANVVHEGEDLAAHIIERCADQRRGLRTYAEGLFATLIAVNQAGADALDVAAWAVAERADRPVFLQAAE